MPLVLFDLDGTLLRSGGAGVRAMTRAGRHFFGPDFSLDGVVIAGGLDPLLFDEAARRVGITDPRREHDAFRELYLVVLAEELAAYPERVRALPGIPRLLDLLDQHEGATMGLATGNYRRAAPLKLTGAGIDPERFRIQVFGDEAPDRTAMIALALERYGTKDGSVNPAHVVVVGDTPRDVQSARENGCRSLAVATGGYSEADLRQAGADVTVPDLADPAPLLKLLTQSPAFASKR